MSNECRDDFKTRSNKVHHICILDFVYICSGLAVRYVGAYSKCPDPLLPQRSWPLLTNSSRAVVVGSLGPASPHKNVGHDFGRSLDNQPYAAKRAARAPARCQEATKRNTVQPNKRGHPRTTPRDPKGPQGPPRNPHPAQPNERIPPRTTPRNQTSSSSSSSSSSSTSSSSSLSSSSSSSS